MYTHLLLRAEMLANQSSDLLSFNNPLLEDEPSSSQGGECGLCVASQERPSEENTKQTWSLETAERHNKEVTAYTDSAPNADAASTKLSGEAPPSSSLTTCSNSEKHDSSTAARNAHESRTEVAGSSCGQRPPCSNSTQSKKKKRYQREDAAREARKHARRQKIQKHIDSVRQQMRGLNPQGCGEAEGVDHWPESEKGESAHIPRPPKKKFALFIGWVGFEERQASTTLQSEAPLASGFGGFADTSEPSFTDFKSSSSSFQRLSPATTRTTTRKASTRTRQTLLLNKGLALKKGLARRKPKREKKAGRPRLGALRERVVFFHQLQTLLCFALSREKSRRPC